MSLTLPLEVEWWVDGVSCYDLGTEAACKAAGCHWLGTVESYVGDAESYGAQACAQAAPASGVQSFY